MISRIAVGSAPPFDPAVLRLILSAVLVVAGCRSTGPIPVVDGWPIGTRFVCSSQQCAPYLRIATEGLARRDVGHAPIVEATLHELGEFIGSDGQQKLMVFSGGTPSVVLFGLADGSHRAIGVKTGIGGDVASSAWGPGLDFRPPIGR